MIRGERACKYTSTWYDTSPVEIQRNRGRRDFRQVSLGFGAVDQKQYSKVSHFQFDLHTATQPERRTGTGFASVLTGLPACKAPVAYWHHTIKNWGKVHESYSTKAVGGTRVVFCVGRVGADLYHHRPWGS